MAALIESFGTIERSTFICTRDTDGVIVSDWTSWSACDYSSTCDEEAIQTRTRVVCSGAGETTETDTTPCTRDTDGVIVSDWTSWGACDYSSTCDESANQTRTRVVCSGGGQTTQADTQPCTRDTDGNDCGTTGWGSCGGYSSTCDETGTQSRTLATCSSGSCSSSTPSQACERDTDGTVVSYGSWSACGGYSSTCDEDGTQTRTNQVCSGGSQTSQTQSQVCYRDTDGIVISDWTSWSACSGYSTTCDESGSQSRTRVVCSSGGQTTETGSQTCYRDTDGTDCGTTSWSACGGYSSTCDETGTQSRTLATCSSSSCSSSTPSQACERDTDGTVVSYGSWSSCGGYSSTCDESGTRSRTNQVCSGGSQTSQSQSEGCSRDTDGVSCGTDLECRGGVCEGICNPGNVTVRTVADVYLDSSSGGDDNWNGEYLLFGDSGGYYQVVYLRFENPYSEGLPTSGVSIDSVSLCVSYLSSLGVWPGTSIDIHAWELNCSSNWNESTVTWDSGCSTGSHLGSMTYSEGFSYYCMDISSVDISTLYGDGIGLGEMATSGKHIMFYDHEHSGSSNPSVRINWECP